MNTVIIYKELLLNASETFIAAQAGALLHFKPYYVGLRKPYPNLPFAGDALYLAPGFHALSRLRGRLYRAVPVAPLFHRQIRRIRARLIHAHFAPDGIRASRLGASLGIPVIVTLHGYDATVRRDFKVQYARLWEQAALFLCVSEFIRRKAIEAGFPAHKLLVHRVGVDLTRFAPSSDARLPDHILFIGRLVEKKGCATLLEAMRYVQAEVPGSALTIIGNGPLRQALELSAARLHIQCRFLGAQSTAVVRNWMRKASVLCVPSQTASDGDCEGLPTVILEAMATRLPIVSTLHAGIPEAVIDGETGLLTPEGDAPSLARSLIRYLRDQKLAGLHSARGRTRVESEFDLARQTEILELIYKQV